MVLKKVQIKCDKCFRLYPHTGHMVNDVRALAKAANWVYGDGEDVCPQCRIKRQDGHFHESRAGHKSRQPFGKKSLKRIFERPSES